MTEQENNQIEEKVLIEDPHEKEKFNLELDNFQGPFDLLLHLIEEQKVEIYDVSIAQITSAYLDYLAKIQKLDLEVAGEFLIMAAALVEMKSRMLLPTDEMTDEELLAEIETERLSLLERLVEYKRYKGLAKELVDKEKDFAKVFSRAKVNEQIITAADEDREILLKEINLQDLLRAFAKVWQRASDAQKPQMGEIFDDRYTVREKMEEVVQRLKKGKHRFDFEDLFQEEFHKMEVITTFLAILELMKQRFIRLMQKEVYGKIEIIGYDVLPENMIKVDDALEAAEVKTETKEGA